MKIVLTGGGSGGHFYPIVAVAESLRKEIYAQKLLDAKIYYLSDEIFDKSEAFNNDVKFVKIPAGKMRLYLSPKTIIDILKTIIGIFVAFGKMFAIYPDVVFSKGGYASFPTVFVARLLRIPVILHESDTAPGRVNKWTGKFASRIAISYPEAAKYFPEGRVAYTGNPIRQSLLTPSPYAEDISIDSGAPLILVIGGSQGAKLINDNLIDVLSSLLEKYQVFHQCGEKNIEDVKKSTDVLLEKSSNKERYKVAGLLRSQSMRHVAEKSSLVISRAGSGLFEIAVWGKPSIIIPITQSNGNHQRMNAYSFAKNGAAIVIEERNITPNVLRAEIDRIMSSKETQERMSAAAKANAKLGAADTIAKEIVYLALHHK